MVKGTEHTTIRVGYYGSAIVLVLIILMAVYTLILPLVLGFLLAFMITPFVTSLERRGVHRALGTLSIFTILGVLVYSGIAIAAPIIQTQIEVMSQEYTLYEQTLVMRLDSLRLYLLHFCTPNQVALLEEHAEKFFSNKIDVVKVGIPHYVTVVFSTLGTLIFIPVIALLLSIEGRSIKKRLVSFVPNRYFEMVLMIIHQINNQIGGYIRGQIYDCIIIGVLASVGLSILGVKGAIVIGVFAGAANAIPYLGPVVGAIPAICVLLIDPTAPSPWWTVPIVFLIVNLLDNFFVYPMTIGKSLSLHPLVVILGILFGGSLFGVIGMIIAVPLIGIVSRVFSVWTATLRSYQII
ncbi:MAG: AI-2E family transporter [Fibrobacterales bacterium]